MKPCDTGIPCCLIRRSLLKSWSVFAFGFYTIAVLVCCFKLPAQQLGSHAPPAAATGAERLLIEQVEALSQAKQFDEAIATLEKLFEQGEGSLIEAEGLQRAATLTTQRYISIRQWSQARLSTLLADNVETRASYLSDHDEAASAALADVALSKELGRARLAAERFCQTSPGIKLQLLLADIYLERGWGVAALQCVQKQLPCMRCAIPNRPTAGSSELNNQGVATNQAATTGSIAWQVVAEHLSAAELQLAMQEWHASLVKEAWQTAAPEKLATELLQRVIDAAVIELGGTDRESLSAWTTAMAETLSPEPRKVVLERLKLADTWRKNVSNSAVRWPTFAGSNTRQHEAQQRIDPAGWPTWNHPLERYSANSDRLEASRPRVGESDSGLLSYHPVVSGGRVYLNELTRISAFDLKLGSQWPEMKPPLPLFDSHIAPSALLPLGYPMVGAVRGTVAVYADCLYARMGAPVTGWANGEKSGDGGSIGYLVGLDLKRQGSLLKGFPLRLSQFDFAGSEPEGCPLVIGDKLFVTVAKRDNVGLRRYAAAFDRFSGELIWKSPALAVGVVAGSDRANLLSHQLLAMSGGRLFYNTNLGSIACLDPLTGQIEWLVRYRRSDKEKQAYPQPDRFRYRDLNPCLIQGGMVYCAPQDCAEIFALDAITGDLVWSTNDSAAADAVHLLGVTEGHLIASGDRLMWLDCHTGRIDGRFPAAGVSGNLNALPSPRGLGRGLISAGEIYWPTADEIIVFTAKLRDSKSVDAPPMKRRIRLDTRGSEGGNLVAVDGWLLVATPSRLMAFAPLDAPSNEKRK